MKGKIRSDLLVKDDKMYKLHFDFEYQCFDHKYLSFDIIDIVPNVSQNDLYADIEIEGSYLGHIDEWDDEFGKDVKINLEVGLEGAFYNPAINSETSDTISPREIVDYLKSHDSLVLNFEICSDDDLKYSNSETQLEDAEQEKAEEYWKDEVHDILREFLTDHMILSAVLTLE